MSLPAPSGGSEISDRAARQRFSAQLLAGPPATDPVQVVERITAVQAQDPRGFRLAVRSRSTVDTAAVVDRCLTQDRSLVVDWLNRGTLHLVRAEDHAWLHALTTPRLLTSNLRRLQQEGVSLEQRERGIQVIERSLLSEGPLTRAALRDRLDSADIPTAGQALVHLLGAASFAGVCLRGPMVGTEHAFVHVREWLGPQPVLDHEQALSELARRYLLGHGPATDRDLAAWSGLALREVRRGLASLGAALHDDGAGLLTLGGGSEAAEATDDTTIPPPRLLGAFDPLLHGWASRRWIVAESEQHVVTSNGIFRPIALVEGRAAATWGLAAGTVTRHPLAGVSWDAETELALDLEAARVQHYLAGSDPA